MTSHMKQLRSWRAFRKRLNQRLFWKHPHLSVYGPFAADDNKYTNKERYHCLLAIIYLNVPKAENTKSVNDRDIRKKNPVPVYRFFKGTRVHLKFFSDADIKKQIQT